jgi:hypothetical protein
MTPAPSLHELIATVQQDSPSDDPLDLLATASTTVTSLSTVGDAVLDHFVAGARAQGRSWTEISSVLGVSKQAAHKRFSGPKDDFSITFNADDFQRFTDRARNTVSAAQQLALGWGHNYIGTEHLLVAQFTEPRSIAAKVLDDHGITRATVEAKVLEQTPAGEPLSGLQVPFTPRAKQGLKGALTAALELGHNYIGTEHLLLGLYAPGAGDGLAGKILTDLGLTAEQAKEAVVAALSSITQQKAKDEA